MSSIQKFFKAILVIMTMAFLISCGTNTASNNSGVSSNGGVSNNSKVESKDIHIDIEDSGFEIVNIEYTEGTYNDNPAVKVRVKLKNTRNEDIDKINLSGYAVDKEGNKLSNFSYGFSNVDAGTATWNDGHYMMFYPADVNSFGEVKFTDLTVSENETANSRRQTEEYLFDKKINIDLAKMNRNDSMD